VVFLTGAIVPEEVVGALGADEELPPTNFRTTKITIATRTTPIMTGMTTLSGEGLITGGLVDAGGWYPGGGGDASSGVGRGDTVDVSALTSDEGEIGPGSGNWLSIF